MTDELMLAILDGPPKRRPSAVKARAPQRATGAMISGNQLVVMTVEQRDRLSFELVESCSFDVTLEERAQMHVLSFAEEVRGWIRSFKIQQLSLRMTPPRGHYTASPFAFKIETVLQMFDWLFLEVVNTQAVANWVNREDPLLPIAPDTGGARLAKLRMSAIEMAAYAIRFGSDERSEKYVPYG